MHICHIISRDQIYVVLFKCIYLYILMFICFQIQTLKDFIKCFLIT